MVITYEASDDDSKIDDIQDLSTVSRYLENAE